MQTTTARKALAKVGGVQVAAQPWCETWRVGPWAVHLMLCTANGMIGPGLVATHVDNARVNDSYFPTVRMAIDFAATRSTPAVV